MNMNRRLLMIAAFLLTASAITPLFAATTITYTYDKQHRLTQASYSESEKVMYSYDAANNLDLEVSITDSKYLKSFLLWLAKAGDTIKDVGRSLAWWRDTPPTSPS